MKSFLTKTALIALLSAGPAVSGEGSIIVQSTTSTANSGLYDHILPTFQDETGITVNIVAVGTGQAIKNARNCDGDVLIVHAKSVEEEFVADGFGTSRTDLMYNDFIIVGPAADPARIASATDVQDALGRIFEAQALFASRGDDSGTHKREVALWNGTGLDPAEHSGQWYRETGSGMGATLNIGIGMGAYVLTDRSTWVSFANKQDFDILVSDGDDLLNQYGVIPVSPGKCPSVNADAARVFVDWLLSPQGQDAIASFEVADQQLFFPNAPRD